jgi:hypothetical protein
MTRTKLGVGIRPRDAVPRAKDFRTAVQQQFASFEQREREWLAEDRDERAQRLAARIALPILKSLRSK